MSDNDVTIVVGSYPAASVDGGGDVFSDADRRRRRRRQQQQFDGSSAAAAVDAKTLNGVQCEPWPSAVAKDGDDDIAERTPLLNNWQSACDGAGPSVRRPGDE